MGTVIDAKMQLWQVQFSFKRNAKQSYRTTTTISIVAKDLITAAEGAEEVLREKYEDAFDIKLWSAAHKGQVHKVLTDGR